MSEFKKMKLSEVHPDVSRYLAHDCYCPGEIYGFDGIFCQVFKEDETCFLISDGFAPEIFLPRRAIAVICYEGREEYPQIVILVRDPEDESKIIDAVKFDATENNLDLVLKNARGESIDGMKIDEHDPGSTKRMLDHLLDMSDFVMVSS